MMRDVKSRTGDPSAGAGSSRGRQKPDFSEGSYIELHSRDGKLAERLRIGPLLGQGGFAKCYQVSVGKNEYACKVVDRASLQKPSMMQKLRSEIQIHRRLNHRNIVRFDRNFSDEWYVYLLLEKCEKYTLLDLSKRRQRFSVPETQHIMLQTLAAIQYLHDNNVIHRDLKLGNMMVDSAMNVKIGDFGLAAEVKFDGDRKRTICGTPNYIAPEVLQSGFDGHSYEVDIWALGVILYTLLVGAPPFQTSDVKKTYRRIAQCQYQFPLGTKICSAGKDLIHRILQSCPDDRLTLVQIRSHPFFSVPTPPKSAPLTLFMGTDIVPHGSAEKASPTEALWAPQTGRRQSNPGILHAVDVNTPPATKAGAALAAPLQKVTEALAPGVSGGGLQQPPRLSSRTGDAEAALRYQRRPPVDSSPPLARPAPPSQLANGVSRPIAKMLSSPAYTDEEVGRRYSARTNLHAEALPQVARRQLGDVEACDVDAARRVGNGAEEDHLNKNAPLDDEERNHLTVIHDQLQHTFHAQAPDAGDEAAEIDQQDRQCSDRAAAPLSGVGARRGEISGRPVESPCVAERHAPPLLSSPRVWVTDYADFSGKYGLCYKLNTGHIGVFYNDLTKMTWEPITGRVEYYARVKKVVGGVTQAQDELEAFHMDAYPASLEKKVTLIKYFKSYLAKVRTIREGVEVVRCSAYVSTTPVLLSDPNMVSDMVYVKRWMRTSDATIFRFSNRTIQVSFGDMAEVLLSSESQIVTYTSSSGERFTIALAAVASQSDEIATRLRMTKDILSGLIKNREL